VMCLKYFEIDLYVLQLIFGHTFLSVYTFSVARYGDLNTCFIDDPVIHNNYIKYPPKLKLIDVVVQTTDVICVLFTDSINSSV
jgi:hypothetical protein